MTDNAIPNSIDRPESIIEPNSAYKLGEVCPTGKHVGVVHAHIAGGRMVLDHPPVYVCGCYYIYK